MEITQESIDLKEVGDVLRGHPDNRDPLGFHVTDLYWEAQRISKGKNKPDYSGVVGLADMGFIWEYAVRKWLQERLRGYAVVFSPTYVLEDVKATLDALAIGPVALGLETGPKVVIKIVIDAKVKFGKLKDPLDRPDWLWQLKSYCKMVGTRRASLVVLNILSNPPSVIGYMFDLQFTETEIEEHWSTLIQTKLYVEREGHM